MNNKIDPPRGLEKVYHFFLTGEHPSDQKPEILIDNSIKDKKDHLSNSRLYPSDIEFDRLENTVAQLYVLRDSCRGMYHSQNPQTDIIWFHGAATILQDAITNLIKTLRFIENNP